MVLNDFRSQEITWDKASRKIFETLETSGGDSNGRKIILQVLDNGKIVDLSGVNLSLAWKKPNGENKGLDAFEIVDATKGLFEIFYTTQMLSNIGVLKASFVLVDNTGRIESDSFTIVVNGSVVDDNSIQSLNSFTSLTTALIEVNGWNQRIDLVEKDYEDRAAILEETYAPKLTEVASQLAQTNEQVDLLNRGLGETFSTFTELEIAYPNGDTKDHIIGADGHRYFWNEVSWSDGGAYQAIEIGKGSVTTDKLSTVVQTQLKSTYMNSFVNGEMKVDTSNDGVADGWTVYTDVNIKGTVAVNVNGQVITLTESPTVRSGKAVYQQVTVPSNINMNLEFYHKESNYVEGFQSYYLIEFRNSSGTIISNLNGLIPIVVEMSKYSINLTTPTGAVSMRVYLMARSNGLGQIGTSTFSKIYGGATPVNEKLDSHLSGSLKHRTTDIIDGSDYGNETLTQTLNDIRTTTSYISENLCISDLNIGFINLTGVIQSQIDENWRYTKLFDVSEGEEIRYDLYGHPNIGSIVFSDANGNFISNISAPSANARIKGVVIVPTNTRKMRLSFSSVLKFPLEISSTYIASNIKLISDNNTIAISNLQQIIPSKQAIPYIAPYKLYTVCNDIIASAKGHNRNYSSAIYLDHLFKGLTSEKHIRFGNNSDKIVFNAPIVVTDANEASPAVTYNGGVNVLETSKSIDVTGNDIIDSSFNVVHASTLNSVTAQVTPRVLCIGDSLTYAELAQINDDNHLQNWAYHLMAKEFFMKDNIDVGSGHDCLFLGQFKKTRTMKYKDVEYPVTTHHEGIRGISLSSYLTGGVASFKSATTLKFSIDAWIAKYRTMDDIGNRLTLGSGTGSLITSNNINNIDVCMPSHILIMLGANGGGTLSQYQELINIIKTEHPDIIVGIVLSDSAGTFFPSLHPNSSEKTTIWNDVGSQGSRHDQQYNLVSMLQTEYGNSESESNGIYFLPFYFVQPTAESVSMRRVDLPDANIELMADNLYNDSYGWHASTHVNGIGHINWGYQLYSWLKYTIAKGL